MKPMHFVLLRGLARCHCHWEEFPEMLKQAFPGSIVTFIDQPGTGGRTHMDYSLKMVQNVNSIRNDYLEKYEKEHLDKYETFVIGISLGGMAALCWAKEYPNDFKKLAVINTSVADCKILYRLQPRAFKAFSKAFFNVDDIEREKVIFELTSSKKIDENIVKKWASCSRNFEMHRDNVFRQLLAASRFKCPKNIKQDLLILASRKDKLCDYRCSFEIHDMIANSDLEFHTQAGHDIPLDDPEWVVEKVKNFMK